MATSLYFPEGVPQEVQRLLNPDAIHQVTREGLDSLEREWSILARSADKITKGDLGFWKGLFKHLSYDPSPNWIQHFLYQKPSDWPSGLSEKEKDALKILRELRKLSSTSSHILTAEDYQNPPPSEQAMAKALSSPTISPWGSCRTSASEGSGRHRRSQTSRILSAKECFAVERRPSG